jgi:hypothetical protein
MVEFVLIFSENVGVAIRISFAGSIGVVAESFLLINQRNGLERLV